MTGMDKETEIEGLVRALSEELDKRNTAIAVAVRFGDTQGEGHKDWVIDQMVRALAGDDYDAIVADACDGNDGPDTYEWSTGTPP